MNRHQIDLLRKNPELQGADVIETHISWLILTTDNVYKMKKDVQFSFLDFSTQGKRKFYCERELQLNRRLAPDLYEDVVAINPVAGGLEFGNYRIDTVDYAIKMRRVASQWEMAAMLQRDEVLPVHIDRLADKLSVFHQDRAPETSLFTPIAALDDFADIGQYENLLTPHLGAAKTSDVLAGIPAARSFLRRHHQRFHYRRMLGFTVDGHGDLHTANVFLENDEPLIFDCIEFNDAFRKVDVLDEVAFLCIDLEAAGREDLAEQFAARYQAGNRTLLTGEDKQLFAYYKCYRANVRLKVTAIKIDNLPDEAHAGELLARLHRYEEVYRKYVATLKTPEAQPPEAAHDVR